MNQRFDDITSVMGKPKWWDARGFPRYCEFRPEEVSDIYSDHVALIEIRCQSCLRHFMVAVSWSVMDQIFSSYGRDTVTLPDKDSVNSFHYGDPPNDGCCASGPTMNVDSVRIHEFWSRLRRPWEWLRRPELEFTYNPDES